MSFQLKTHADFFTPKKIDEETGLETNEPLDEEPEEPQMNVLSAASSYVHCANVVILIAKSPQVAHCHCYHFLLCRIL